MSDELKKNILSTSQWLRILYMAFFAVVCWVMGIIMTVLVVAQALFSLLTGKDNDNLRQLGGSLSRYFYEILLFLTYRSEHKPFPFAPFPETEAAAPPDAEQPADAPSGAVHESGPGESAVAGGAAAPAADEGSPGDPAQPPVTPMPPPSEPETGRPGEGEAPTGEDNGGNRPPGTGGPDPERGI